MSARAIVLVSSALLGAAALGCNGEDQQGSTRVQLVCEGPPVPYDHAAIAELPPGHGLVTGTVYTDMNALPPVVADLLPQLRADAELAVDGAFECSGTLVPQRGAETLIVQPDCQIAYDADYYVQCLCSASDLDGDGTPDIVDACPIDPNKADSSGQCGCGVLDVDADGDGVADCHDACPADASQTYPGPCGCNVAVLDGDGDGVFDCLDGCPTDPNKRYPGSCGCNVLEADTNGDGIVDCGIAPPDPVTACPGDVCVIGSPLAAACTPLDLAGVCAYDAYCCTVEWDATCVSYFTSPCPPWNPGCGATEAPCAVTQPPPQLMCPQDRCVAGSPLTVQCSAEDASGVCSFDPYCCTVAWDQVCVSYFGTLCTANPV